MLIRDGGKAQLGPCFEMNLGEEHDVYLEFEVTDPRRSFAGPTVYRVVLKVSRPPIPSDSVQFSTFISHNTSYLQTLRFNLQKQNTTN